MSHEEASAKKMLADLGYTWIEMAGGGEIRNAANDAITSATVAEIRAWCNGVRHGLAALKSCVHLPTNDRDAKAHHAHSQEVASCPWCIVVRKERELEALRKVVARLEASQCRSKACAHRRSNDFDRIAAEVKGKKRG